jgi:hypothetical protein
VSRAYRGLPIPWVAVFNRLGEQGDASYDYLSTYSAEVSGGSQWPPDRSRLGLSRFKAPKVLPAGCQHLTRLELPPATAPQRGCWGGGGAMRYRMSRKEGKEMVPREKQCRNVQPKEHCNLKSLGICSLPSVRRPTSGTPVSNATQQLQACVLRTACIATYPPAVRGLTNSKSPQVAGVVRGLVNHKFLPPLPGRVEGCAMAVDYVDLASKKGFCHASRLRWSQPWRQP